MQLRIYQYSGQLRINIHALARLYSICTTLSKILMARMNFAKRVALILVDEKVLITMPEHNPDNAPVRGPFLNVVNVTRNITLL